MSPGFVPGGALPAFDSRRPALGAGNGKLTKGVSIMAQVHRFRDKVAVYVGGGETVYLSPKNARKLARALNAAARSCDREPFAQSSGLTVAIEES
jgi:hypothetical protein